MSKNYLPSDESTIWVSTGVCVFSKAPFQARNKLRARTYTEMQQAVTSEGRQFYCVLVLGEVDQITASVQFL